MIEEMNKVSGFTETFIAGPYALASPLRRATRSSGAIGRLRAELSVRPSPLPHVQANTVPSQVEA